MRNATLKDIAAVERLIDKAGTSPIGESLAKALEGICHRDYSHSCIITDTQTLVRPTVCKGTIFLKDKETGDIICIDTLPGQFREDVVRRIWNELKKNTEEIENL